MTNLISELIELARREPPAASRTCASTSSPRTRSSGRGGTGPASRSRSDFEESLVHGVPATIDRAVGNLLDNAAKWSPPGGEVEIAVQGGEVTVRDHGPGSTRTTCPTSSTASTGRARRAACRGRASGLAIVKQVAEAHGGTVVAERPDGGGTLMRFRLNGSRATRQRKSRFSRYADSRVSGNEITKNTSITKP